MYRDGETYYTEDHSVSFGNLTTRTSGGLTYYDFANTANTWTDWHLIPSSRPSVAQPTIVTKFIEIPGADGMLDLTSFLTGKQNYGQRQGSMQFYAANHIEDWETIRYNMVQAIHGKRMKMRLMDDPTYYYEGRFTVGNWESGPSYSSISISYQLDPYKIKINLEGTYPMIWDTFNFERDYDYGTGFIGGSNIGVYNIGAGTYYIYAGDYPFQPTATYSSGYTTVSFGGVSGSLSPSSTSIELGKASPGKNTLTVTGTGKISITWRGGAL